MSSNLSPTPAEDWGARDPTPGELASDFSDKVLGNWDTEHLIRPPESIGSLVGLSSKRCTEGAPLLSERDAERLRNQVPGWKLTRVDEMLAIRHDWRCRSVDAALQLRQRIEDVAKEVGHSVDVTVVGAEAFAELTSRHSGGLTENDFIFASKVNEMDNSDVLAKSRVRYWA